MDGVDGKTKGTGMSDKNEVTIEGCIKGKVFDYAGVGGKTPMVKMNIECKSEYVGNDGKLNAKSCSVPVTLFGSLAGKFGPEKPGGSLLEGTRMRISGYIANNSYISKKDGNRVFETRVIARTADAIDSGPPEDDSAIPF